MKKRSIIFLLVFFCAGCVSVGRQIDQASVEKIHKGETTKDQAVGLLGPPNSVTQAGNGETIFVYFYIRSAAKPETFIPCIGPLVGGATAQQQILTLTFGQDGIVKNISRTETATDSSMGISSGGKPETPNVK